MQITDTVKKTEVDDVRKTIYEQKRNEIDNISNYSVEDFIKEMNKLPHTNISKAIKERIIKIPKGEKPDPSLYISSTEMAEHLSLFKNGAVKIQSKDSFEKAIQWYGSSIGDPATSTFVLPKDVVDKAIKAYNGNPRVLEELLGLDAGYLEDNPILLDIHKPSNIRMPSGNESGAWPEYWISGGYTSGGVPEAVIDQIKLREYTISDIYPKS